MTANPSIEALRKALEARPTPGPWESDDTAVYLNGEGGFDLFHAPAAKANAAFIAAANPEAIRTLLALVDAQEADAKRYRWLRAQHEGLTDPLQLDAEGLPMLVQPVALAFTVFRPDPSGYESLVPVGCLEGELDAAIDSAMKETK